ncbi:MAG: TetR/AcrR family transcriptional regulator [Desulfobacterales bacterium]|nr:TetR/AcrR family transcriptional regulator [Desulfobacterales bacterium]
MNKGLEQRAKPKQDRAIKTYELILKTSAELLVEVGLERFSTFIVAEKANLSMRSVYRYFPNKLSIIKALAEQYFERDLQILDGRYDSLKNLDINFVEALEVIIVSYYEMVSTDPTYMAIKKAFTGSQELMEYEEQINQKYAIELAKALKTRMPKISDKKLKIISMNIMDVSDTMIYRAHKYLHYHNDKKSATEIIEEFKLMLRGYIASHLNQN